MGIPGFEPGSPAFLHYQDPKQEAYQAGPYPLQRSNSKRVFNSLHEDYLANTFAKKSMIALIKLFP